ncbi:phosphomannomutase [Novosphingobium fuchskuhlense]|uniref:phosphomannomutase n=1 Tax=Novosphingobium fuchskuhlense TaxID=1117702 RepID=UPI00308402DB
MKDLMAESGVAFGTSGARGLVSAMTDRVCYGYATGFLSYVRELGEYPAGGRVAIAGDLRPSTPRIVAACIQAVRDLGGEPVFCGFVPTPALALYSFAERIPSIMVTGSHIPADRNGIKFYRPTSEVLKDDEAGMAAQMVAFGDDTFDASGALREAQALPAIVDVEAAYLERYVQHFGAGALRGKRVGVYQHSAVGRDLLDRILRGLGAETVLLGRSDTFVPVDTEAIRDEDVALAHEWASGMALDAIVSTDGDSDRPLLADEAGTWLRGDVLGVLAARRIKAETVVTPVSSNTALELSGAIPRCFRTRIGSPYVVAAMQEASRTTSGLVCGYEANGGFLLGSDCSGVGGTRTSALPTRDAVLPMLLVLTAHDGPLSAQLATLPPRFTFSDRLTDFASELGTRLFALLEAGGMDQRLALQNELFGAFAGVAVTIDDTDGIRTTFDSGEIIHLRRSGNAPELRCYAEADTAERAAALSRLALPRVMAKLGIAAGAD